jgi:ATPase subunit of ABC transporter with duplicated ATPase domains
VTKSGPVGYLPQGPGEGDQNVTATERIMSGRGLDRLRRDLQAAEHALATGGEEALRRYGQLEDRFQSLGGYAAEASAASIAAGVGLPDHVLSHRLRELSGGQRRRVELARILFSESDTLLLDEPTNHLDADSIAWLRDYLQRHRGGWMVISHDVELIEATVNRVLYLDATRAALDPYNMGWRAYLLQRETDERRQSRERANAEKKASALQTQADKMKAKATRAKQALQMERRAEKLLAGVGEQRRTERIARFRLPDPAPSGRQVLSARGLAKSYSDARVFEGLDIEIERGSRTVILGHNGAGKTTLLRILGGLEKPSAGMVMPGHGLRLGYYAQEHETLDPERSVLQNMQAVAPGSDVVQLRKILGSFLFSGDTVQQETATLSGGEKTRLALAALVISGANLLMLDEPTNNLDPASRDEVLGALAGYRGAVLLVTHDEGAVEALRPERVILMPEGVQDYWDPSFGELVSLA